MMGKCEQCPCNSHNIKDSKLLAKMSNIKLPWRCMFLRQYYEWLSQLHDAHNLDTEIQQDFEIFPLTASAFEISQNLHSDSKELEHLLQEHLENEELLDNKGVALEELQLDIHRVQHSQDLLAFGQNKDDVDTHSHVLCVDTCLLYTSPSPRDLSTSRMPSSA
eukprot:TRINITY_DN5022_c0_g1_i1.p2 TRINITY_DN5022_c0_g1~~TRINITY_DN5022_c0_g1_i1.p2  ORF type:complete len:163 (+),score=8.79 TRINITY_DN5022_c0_g1_i1:262-750(+)